MSLKFDSSFAHPRTSSSWIAVRPQRRNSTSILQKTDSQKVTKNSLPSDPPPQQPIMPLQQTSVNTYKPRHRINAAANSLISTAELMDRGQHGRETNRLNNWNEHKRSFDQSGFTNDQLM